MVKFCFHANINGAALAFRDNHPPRPFDVTKLEMYGKHTFGCNGENKNLPTSLRMACIHHFFSSSLSGNLKNPIYSPFGPTRPLSLTPMFLAMPPKPRFGELGSGLNRASAIYE